MSRKPLTWSRLLEEAPPDWSHRWLGDLLDERIETARQELPLLSVTSNRGVVYRDSLNRRDTSSEDKSKYKFAAPGDIVYNTMRMWQGVSGVARVQGIVSPAYTVMIPKEGIEVEFMAHFLKWPSLVSVFRARSQGLVDDTLSLKFDELSKIPVRIPSRTEQYKIAAILSLVDEVIDNAELCVEHLTGVSASLLNFLTSTGMPKVIGGRQTATASAEGWTVTSLDSLVAAGRPICYGVLKPGEHTPYGIPVVRVQDYRENVIDVRGVPRSHPDIVTQFKRSQLREGDILISIRGTTGRVCRVPSDLEGANISRDSARISLADRSLVDYMFFFLQSDATQRFLKGEVRGLAVKGINIQDLRRLPVHIPPEPERSRVVTILTSCFNYMHSLKEEVRALINLRSALSSTLFSGQIRVTCNEAPS